MLRAMQDPETRTALSMLKGRLVETAKGNSRGSSGNKAASETNEEGSVPYLRVWLGDQLAGVAANVKLGQPLDQAKLDELTLTLLVTELAAAMQERNVDRFAIQDLIKTMAGYRSSKKPGSGKNAEDALTAREAEAFVKKLAEESA